MRVGQDSQLARRLAQLGTARLDPRTGTLGLLAPGTPLCGSLPLAKMRNPLLSTIFLFAEFSKICINSDMTTYQKDQIALQMLRNGVFSVSGAGTITRLKIRRPNSDEYAPCKPCVVGSHMCNGYVSVHISGLGFKTEMLAHRLVWMAHHGEIPIGLTINHIDGVKSNNRIENLELATMKEQYWHARNVLGRFKGRFHLTADSVKHIRLDLMDGMFTSEAALKYGCSKASVEAIARFENWDYVDIGVSKEQYCEERNRKIAERLSKIYAEQKAIRDEKERNRPKKDRTAEINMVIEARRLFASGLTTAEVGLRIGKKKRTVEKYWTSAHYRWIPWEFDRNEAVKNRLEILRSRGFLKEKKQAN